MKLAWLAMVPFVGGVWVLAIAGQPSPVTPVVKPLEDGPIHYYQQACAHCHGPYGSAYEPPFFTHTDLAKLTDKVKTMAEGPGQAPLSKDEALKSQVAFHQALIEKRPFIDWTGQEGSELSGEVTRGATLTATAGGQDLTVSLRKADWKLTLPAGVSVGSVRLKATKDGREAELNLKDGSYWRPATWPPKP